VTKEVQGIFEKLTTTEIIENVIKKIFTQMKGKKSTNRE